MYCILKVMILSVILLSSFSLFSLFSMVSTLKLTTLAAALAPSAVAFTPAYITNAKATQTTQFAKPQGDDKVWAIDESTQESPAEFKFPNPFSEIADMFQSFDDVVDDFFNKRMGNGEIFYGKRKYKPSGNVESEYNGGGFSDWRKIEAAREFREERARIRAEEKARESGEK